MTAPTLTFNGRLPGVDCQPALPPAPPVIRLDVAGLVGFAERGPLDVPVAVTDINQYAAVFGGDVVLATDSGIPVYANLPGAVRAFFDNGGQRCYVVRVAGPDARAARWLLPGMRLWQPDGVVEDVYVQAAWPGCWSRNYGVGTQLLAEPLAVAEPYRRAGARPGVLSLDAGSLLPLQRGDLLRLDLGPLRPGLYVTVGQVDLARSTVQTGTEIAFLTGLVSPPEPDEQLPLGPDALAALPATLPVRAAWRLQLDLIVRDVLAGSAQLLERWPSLGFNQGSAPSWLDVIQPAGDSTPDQTRSMLLRADAGTAAAAGPGLFLPAGMDQLGSAAEFRDPAAGPSGESAAVTGLDGLSRYAPADMFLDHQLRQATVYSLLSDADQLTVLAPHPARLRGIHALIGVDEVALISVPDAVHPGWSPAAPAPLPAPAPPAPPPVPDWSDFRDCAAPGMSPPPAATAAGPPSAAAASSLAPHYPVLDDPAGYDSAGLLAVHAAVVQLCAARSDMFAVLSVPRHYDTAAVLGWLRQLGAAAGPSQAGAGFSPLSFAGFWHPWVRAVEPATPALAPLRDQPADGAVCGMVAARELDRGVWVAPAKVPLRGPVALTRALSAADTIRLFDAHANLLRPQPGAISALSAHTLAAEPALLQVSVRRLIILLRKVALLEGSRYVFDSSTDRFRQLVRLRFGRILAALTSYGALAAYQVVTDGAINTADDTDNGRLIVILQVAPTSPIEFITVSLIRAGEGLLDVVVG